MVVNVMNGEEIRAKTAPSVRTLGDVRQSGRPESRPDQSESPMPAALLPTQSLAMEQLLVVDDGIGITVVVDSGEVWITEEGSFIDQILGAGQDYTIDRPGRAIVAARTESCITLRSPGIGVPPKSVERCDPRRAGKVLLYARSLALSAIAGLIPQWARRRAVAV
jgi:hypothetical protein